MKKSSKGFMALTMAVMMATGGLFTGCSSAKASNDTSEKSTSTKKEDTAAQAEVSNEPFKLSMMTFDHEGDPLSGENGVVVKSKIEDYTNTSLDLQFVPNDNYEDKLSITLASGDDMPMIIAVPGLTPNVINAAKAGALWSFNDYIYDKAAYPNLSQSNQEVNKSISIDGNLYGVYRARVLGRNGMGYRDDWAAKLGLSEPKTIDDVYNMMYQFTYGDPDGNGQNDTYGLNLCKYDGPFDIMQTWFGAGNGWVEKDGQLVPSHQTEEYIESLNWFKKIYADGLIASDFAVRDTATWQDDNRNGKAGVFIDGLDGSRRIWDYFVNNDIDATMNLVGAIAKDGNGQPATMATSGYNGFYVITKAAKTEEDLKRCLEFLDRMNDDEMLLLTGYGLEGIHYEFNAEGFLVDLDVDNPAASKAYSAANQLVSYTPNLKATNVKFDDSDRVKLQEKIYKENEKYVVFNPATPYLVNSNTYTLNGANLDTIIKDARIQFIVGQIDEAGLQGIYDQWGEIGGNDIIKEVNEQYKQDK